MKYWKLNRTSQMLILLFFVLLGVHLLMGYRRFQEGAGTGPLDDYIIKTKTNIGIKLDDIEKLGKNVLVNESQSAAAPPTNLCSAVQKLNTNGIVNESHLVGVEHIGGMAFLACKWLESITIPDSVTSIGKGAFSFCAELKSITIPDSVTSIGYDAFVECVKLDNVIITTNASKKDHAVIRQKIMQKMEDASARSILHGVSKPQWARTEANGVNYEVKYVEKKSTGAGAGNSWDPYNKHKKFYKDIKKKCKRNKKCKKCSKKCHNKYIKCTKKQTKKLNKKQRKKPMSRAKFKNAIKKIQKKCDTDKGSLKCNAKCSRKFKLGLTTNT